ncbi:RagB/SusD family nutrient uptake outer membrane protein [Fulvivirgaceae bacterium BMA10]|uniref:RagB/SusD family nutrient uptake outer membrane protein n=1 Tax=Splendidivirga corallicola TaxID=3051826 RepID=A0ABT8KH88_9BACT|nr:RagB/SusD family nutrient uptake outer membrane protein [Fulvivirgaceae bacterium BMA10]
MKKILIIFCLGALLSTGCEDLLDTEPTDQISRENALSDLPGVKSLLISGYSALRDDQYYGYHYMTMPDVLADNIKAAIGAGTGRLSLEAINTVGETFELWATGYFIINVTNTVLERIDGVEGSEAEKNQIRGASYFLRALTYHDLVKTYSRDPGNGGGPGVPILLESFDGLDADAFPARASVNDVYTQIEQDLQSAISLLDNASERYPYEATQVAAKALMSRVKLYQEQWQEAANFAQQVIDEAPVTLENGDNYVNIFLQASEAIFSVNFQLPSDALNVNIQLSQFYRVTGSGVGAGDGVVRMGLLEQYEGFDFSDDSGVTDKRFSILDRQMHGPEEVYFALKYNSYKGPGLDDVNVIRLAEMYLNQAEAFAELGDEDMARQKINVIRSRAGLSDITNAFSGDLLKNEIFKQRRIELAFEGHRFFDLKRRAMDIPKGISGVDCTTECTIVNGDFRVLANIPAREIRVNSSLVQNPGYN